MTHGPPPTPHPDTTPPPSTAPTANPAPTTASAPLPSTATTATASADPPRPWAGVRHCLSRWLAGRLSTPAVGPPTGAVAADEQPTDEQPTDEAAAPDDDPTERVSGAGNAYVCPFCGCGHATPRPRCAACGGLPVVPRDEGRVYATVVRACGASAEPATSAGDRR